MAYLDLRGPMAEAVAGQELLAPSFEAREWQVIELARRDSLASLREPGHMERLGAWLFGERVNPRLADPRLEVLRQMAVQAWHRGYAVPVSMIKTFKEAGFSLDQLELMLAKIGAGRMMRGYRTAH